MKDTIQFSRKNISHFYLQQNLICQQSSFAPKVSLMNTEGLRDLEQQEWIHVDKMQLLEGLGRGFSWISIQQDQQFLSSFLICSCMADLIIKIIWKPGQEEN